MGRGDGGAASRMLASAADPSTAEKAVGAAEEAWKAMGVTLQVLVLAIRCSVSEVLQRSGLHRGGVE